MNRRVILEAENISKIYEIGKYVEVRALKNVNLKIYEGEIIIIMGPSGSGKSTLLNILGTLDKPTNGKIYLNNRDITNLSERELASVRLNEMGFVFQAYNLISTLTALENVMFPMVLAKKYTLKEIRERATELLELVGLGERLNHRPIQLSGGQQQRVAIARALANDPSIILMDEPTGNVDVNSSAIILKIIKMLNKFFGTTFIIVTHNPEIAVISDRIIYIRDGKLYETKKIPKINLNRKIDEKKILRLQMSLLKNELKRLKYLVDRNEIDTDTYLTIVEKTRLRIERIEKILSSDIHEK